MIMRQNNKKIPRNFRGIFSHFGMFADKRRTANKFRTVNIRKKARLAGRYGQPLDKCRYLYCRYGCRKCRDGLFK